MFSSFVPVCILLLAAFLVSIILGAERINPGAFFSPRSIPVYQQAILFRIRLPRSVLAVLTGALLAGAGSVFQLFFRNPLAEPGIMGISSGAVLGAVVAGMAGSAFGWIVSARSLGAFAGALGASVIVTAFAGRRDIFSGTVALLLCGTALGTLYSSLASILLLLNEKELHGMFVWMLGSFNGKNWSDVFIVVLPAVPAFIVLLLCSRTLDLLTGGEMSARALGVGVDGLRLAVIAGGSLAASAAVCAGGTIGFIGLIAPHIVRRLYGAGSRMLVPLSMLWGALILLVSDTVARTVIAPAELPVGIITSLLGAPFFISLVLSGREFRNG